MQKLAWSTVDANIKDLVPTTYEASQAYFAQERLKPKAQQDPLREMCMLNVTAIPDEQDLVLVIECLKLLIPLYPREFRPPEIDSPRRLEAQMIAHSRE